MNLLELRQLIVAKIFVIMAYRKFGIARLPEPMLTYHK